jgi:hypothetical protein
MLLASVAKYMWWCVALDAPAGRTSRPFLQLGSHRSTAAGVCYRLSAQQSVKAAAALFWQHLLVMCVSACGVLTCSCIDSIHMLCQLRCAARMTRACLLLHLSFLQRWRNAWPSPRLRAWPYLAPCLSPRQMGAGCGTPLLRMMGSSYR